MASKRVLTFFVTLVLLLTSGHEMFSRQPKRVYITLDVSGSMVGDKYVLANYTVQMINTLCEKGDEVYLIVNGYSVEEKTKIAELSTMSDPLKFLQKPITDLAKSLGCGGDAEIGSIWRFCDSYKPSDKYDDWMFILGDGIWCTDIYDKVTEKFKKIVESGSLNVCYLQTGSNLFEHNDFTKFSETLGIIDIGKSSVDPKTIRDGCNNFAKKILGFSDSPFKLKKGDDKTIVLTSELPLKQFVIVCQDSVDPKNLPKVISVENEGSSLTFATKGYPSSEVGTTDATVVLNGGVWRVDHSAGIKADSKVKIQFDRKTDLSTVTVFPLVDISFNSLSLSSLSGNLKRLNANTFSICRDESTAKVRLELEEGGDGLSESAMKKMRVRITSDNIEYAATFKDGGFECGIPIESDTTMYYAECDLPGYFHFTTNPQMIVKGDCDRKEPTMVDKEMPESEMGSISISSLRRGEETPVSIYNTESLAILDPSKFDLQVEVENGYLFEKPTIRVDGDHFYIGLFPRGEWCDCLLPDKLHLKIISEPKEGQLIDGLQYSRTIHPLVYNVIKEDSWFSRCKWVLIWIILLIVFLIYLRALTRKCRFAKTAGIDEFYTESFGEEHYGKKKLREKGFGPWLNRWFNPFSPERRTLKFNASVYTTLHFEAMNGPGGVKISQSDYKEDTMSLEGYQPMDGSQKDKKGNKTPIIWKRGQSMQLSQLTLRGRLQYSVKSKGDDIGAFRVFLGMLKIASFAAIATLVFMLLRSF